MMFPFDDPFDADIFNEDYNDDEDAMPEEAIFGDA